MLFPAKLPHSSHRVADVAGHFQFAYTVDHSNSLSVFIFLTYVCIGLWKPLVWYRAAIVEKLMVGETVHKRR